MSWSVSIIGSPEAVVAELERESERQTGQCKVEFDGALPHLIGLVRENFKKPGSPGYYADPVVHLEAAGSGAAFTDSTQVYRNVTVTLRSLSARIVT